MSDTPEMDNGVIRLRPAGALSAVEFHGMSLGGLVESFKDGIEGFKDDPSALAACESAMIGIRHLYQAVHRFAAAEERQKKQALMDQLKAELGES